MDTKAEIRKGVDGRWQLTIYEPHSGHTSFFSFPRYNDVDVVNLPAVPTTVGDVRLAARGIIDALQAALDEVEGDE